MKRAEIITLLVLKYIGLYIVSIIISAGFLTIVKSYDTALKSDDLFIIVMSISLSVICFSSGYLEYLKKYEIN